MFKIAWIFIKRLTIYFLTVGQPYGINKTTGYQQYKAVVGLFGGPNSVL